MDGWEATVEAAKGFRVGTLLFRPKPPPERA
jgi:hypothetical protein